ncbi:hypothetical protein A6V39_04960 [Candidatus Mycoplasma haematobovis]|uniref:Uncharacterized protein n=1 Tax=Candidatus Mycoplasma haematobovis TaxID=432608 RepID=A0A1A9QBD7_9MOLU|nr:hypothetical protein [Candidatus Mycoplasma haematobovis]OAL09777.1 hypothetical protein A6V39_04960 [Candidatus Mycoplasma haematobovis]
MAINLSIGTKVVAGVAGAATIATGGYLTNEYLLGTKITELLKEDDLTLLTKEGEKVQWGKRWQEYVKKGNNKWALSSYQANTSKSDDAPADFKDACIYRSAKRINITSQKDIYDEIAEFCTKGFTVSELIAKDESIQLISAKTTPSDNTKWKAVWSKYFAEAKTENPLGLALTGDIKAETVPNDYGTRCEAKQAEEIKNNKDKAYSVVKQWCTEAKTPVSRPA